MTASGRVGLKKRPKRFVHLIARPLEIAKRLNASSLSESKLQFCHWGVLVCPYITLAKRREEYCTSPMSRCRRPLGTCVELRRVGLSSTYNVNTRFGWDDLRYEWRLIYIKYTGRTELPDHAIVSIGNMNFLLLCEGRYIEHALKQRSLIHLHGVTNIIDPPISTTTLRRQRSESGLGSYSVAEKPGLHVENLAKRFKWAEKFNNWTSEDWKRVIWSDECSIWFGANGSSVRLENDSTPSMLRRH